MSNETGMFKLYDIRAKQQALTGEMKSRLVAALAEYYRESVQADTVVLCRDARLYCAGLMDKVLTMDSGSDAEPAVIGGLRVLK